MKSRNCRNSGCDTMNNEMDKGFSLIELLVVIAIMGIFIGASFAFVGLIQAAATQTPVDTVTELKKCDLYYTKDSDEEVKITGFAMTFDASTGAIKSFNYALADGGTAMQTSGTGRIRAAHGKKESELTIFFATGKYEVK